MGEVGGEEGWCDDGHGLFLCFVFMVCKGRYLRRFLQFLCEVFVFIVGEVLKI